MLDVGNQLWNSHSSWEDEIETFFFTRGPCVPGIELGSLACKNMFSQKISYAVGFKLLEVLSLPM